jgi:non-ribosomal peptide synthase protein (TIGR01720 family)
VVNEINPDFAAPNLRVDSQSLHFELNEEQTELLLKDVHRAFGTEMNDILLTALTLAVRETFSIERVLVALWEHSRESFLKDVDISRTVGWFTSEYPVLLEVTGAAGLRDDENLARQIKAVKEILHRIPNRGIGYGILKYLTLPEHKKGIDFKLAPRIGFNYSGQFDANMGNRAIAIAKESPGRIQSTEGERDFELDVSFMIIHKKLSLTLGYSVRRFKIRTIETFLDHFKTALTAIISFCVGREEKELTPSDLSYKGLSNEELDGIFE